MVPTDMRLIGLCSSERSLFLPSTNPLIYTLVPEFPKAANLFTLSREWVTTDGCWFGNRIYWTLIQLMTTLHTSLSHRLVFSVTVFTVLLDNVFQRRTFCSRAQVLAGWQPSHTNLLLWPLASGSTSFSCSSWAELTSNCQFQTGF
jgi:hypothetical protein